MTLISRPLKRKDARGRPVVSYGYRFWHQGRLYTAFVGPRALALEAEQRERAKCALAAFEGRYGPLTPPSLTWDEAVTRYLQAKADKRSLWKDHQTLAWWGSWLSAHGCTTLQRVTPDLIDQAKTALAAERSPATVYGYLAILRGLCRMAVRRWRVLDRAPTEAVTWPKVLPPAIQIPTAPQRSALLSAAPEPLRSLIQVALLTGLRKAAILALTADDCTARNGWIRVMDAKGGKPYWLPMTPPLASVLAWQGRTGRLFPVHRFPREQWETARTAAGVEWLTFHSLRHTAGTLLSEAGVPQRVIQAYLGHSTGRITERYTHPMEAGLQEAAHVLAGMGRTENRRTTRRTKTEKPAESTQ